MKIRLLKTDLNILSVLPTLIRKKLFNSPKTLYLRSHDSAEAGEKANNTKDNETEGWD